MSRVCRSEESKVLDTERVNEEGELYKVLKCTLNREDSFVAKVMVDGKAVRMEVDSGASLSVMSEVEFKQKFGETVLERTNIVGR